MGCIIQFLIFIHTVYFVPPFLSHHVRIPSIILPHLPLPIVIPGLLRGSIRLKSRILNRHALKPIDALLLHRDAIQVSLAPAAGADGPAQLLAGVEHAGVHPAALLLDGLVLLAAEEHPGAVDGPVAEVALAGHAQGRRGRGEHVAAEGADAVEVFGFRGGAVAAGGLCGGGGEFAGGGGGCC